MEERTIKTKERLCNECGTYNKLDEVKDDTYCKNCGKWLN